MESNNIENFNQLKIEVFNSEIGSIKTILLELFNIINNPRSNAKQLTELIEIDPPLSLRILRLANSAYYGTSKKIYNIQEAIVWIGFDAVKHLALSMKVIEFFNDENIGFSKAELWKSSIVSALMAKAIYRREFRDTGNFIYSAGLLHNIGLIFLDQFRNKEFLENLKHMQSNNKDLYASEKALLAYDHTKLASEIISVWGFPNNLVNAIRYHHNPVIAPNEYRKAATTLFIVDQLINKHSFGYSDLCGYNHFKTQSALRFLKISQESILGIVEYAAEEIVKMNELGWF